MKHVRRMQSKLTFDKICHDKKDNFQKKVCSKNTLNFKSACKKNIPNSVNRRLT